jgi:hypothetical protein
LGKAGLAVQSADAKVIAATGRSALVVLLVARERHDREQVDHDHAAAEAVSVLMFSEGSGSFPPPPEPAEQPAARQQQTGQSGPSYGTGNNR